MRYRLGDTLDVVTKDLAVTLRAAPIASTTAVSLGQRRVTAEPDYRSHARDTAAARKQRGCYALSKALSTLSTSGHDVLGVV